MRSSVVALLCVIGVGVGASQGRAAVLYGDYIVAGTTPVEHLVTFDSASPTVLTSNITVSGLSPAAAGSSRPDAIFELAFQPGTGVLYGLGSDHLYTVNTATGVAAAVGSLSQVVNTQVGFNFDPVSGLIHVVESQSGSTTSEFTLNPATAALAPVGAVSFAAGDTNAGQSPFISSIAYSPTSPSTMYDLDFTSAGATLTTENQSNQTLSTVGITGGTFGGTPVGFAIGSDGTAFVALQLNLADPGNTRLYSENLATGHLTAIDVIGGDNNFYNVESIAEPVTGVPEPVGGAVLAMTLVVGFRRRR